MKMGKTNKPATDAPDAAEELEELFVPDVEEISAALATPPAPTELFAPVLALATEPVGAVIASVTVEQLVA